MVCRNFLSPSFVHIRLIPEHIRHINYLTFVTETALYTITKHIESRNVSEVGNGGKKEADGRKEVRETIRT
jgi:hypothetical protein